MTDQKNSEEETLIQNCSEEIRPGLDQLLLVFGDDADSQRNDDHPMSILAEFDRDLDILECFNAFYKDYAKALERLADAEIRKRLKAHIILILTGHQDYHREHVLHAAEIPERSYARYKALIKKEELLAGKPCEYRRLWPPLGGILDNIE